jgi:hypothetical protein
MTKFVIVPFVNILFYENSTDIYNALGHILRCVRMCTIEADYMAMFQSKWLFVDEARLKRSMNYRG